ncbi:MAG TPA: acetate--CoA ligase family protein [Acidimicrobiales bacterium]
MTAAHLGGPTVVGDPTDVDQLRATGWPLADGRVVVPEPTAKALLATWGIPVPDGRVATSAAGVVAAATDLGGPTGGPADGPADARLVLKAWGAGIVHKSDVGAVRLGLSADDAGRAAHEMAAALGSAGGAEPRFLVERQAPPGTEVIVGVVRRPDVGLVALLGVGGTLTELVGKTVTRLCPLDDNEVDEMVAAFATTGYLDGLRGGKPANREALRSVIAAVAGRDGLAAHLGLALSELECNPVIVDASGATAVDARLILEPAGPAGPGRAGTDGATGHLPAAASTSFDRLFHPRTVAVVGASTTKVSFGNRFLQAYVRRGWTDGLTAIHPQATEIEGVPARPSLADLDGPVDYLVVAVPAKACADLIRSAAGRVGFAQVVTGGFREAGEDGRELETELLRAARESGVRVVGPNCMGAYSPAGRQTWQLDDPTEPGTVSAISQSGGLAGDIIKAGAAAGLRFANLVTVGNAVDVSLAELVDYYAADAATEVIGLYLEGVGDGGALVDALRRVAGHKPVVVLVGALGRQGARASASHTGSLAGDAAVWQAVRAATGIGVVTTLEELLGALALQQRYWSTDVVDSDAVLVAGPGGGASVLSADACDRAGVELTAVDPTTQAHLRELGYGAGTSVANPIEIGIGPGAAVDAFDRVIGPILDAQPYPDVVLHFNVQSFYSYSDNVTRLLEMLDRIAGWTWPTRVCVVLRNLDCATADDAAILRRRAAELGLPIFTRFDDAFTAVRAAKDFTHQRAKVR